MNLGCVLSAFLCSVPLLSLFLLFLPGSSCHLLFHHPLTLTFQPLLLHLLSIISKLHIIRSVTSILLVPLNSAGPLQIHHILLLLHQLLLAGANLLICLLICICEWLTFPLINICHRGMAMPLYSYFLSLLHFLFLPISLPLPLFLLLLLALALWLLFLVLALFLFFHWKAESLSSSTLGNIKFGKCCYQGKIKITPLQQPSHDLQEYLTSQEQVEKCFHEHIRTYNFALAMTSVSSTQNYTVNWDGSGPYTFILEE